MGKPIDSAELDAVQRAIGTRAATVNEIARRAGIEETDWHGTCPRTRRIIRALLRDRGVPIVSSSRGYRITSDPAELRGMAKQLRSRARKITERSTWLDRQADQAASHQ